MLERIRSAGELRFVTRNSPTTYYLGPGEPRGIEYELARKFADRLGVALRIMTASQPGQVVPTLIRGSADIAATGLAIDADNRRESVELGPSYQHSLQQVIYQRGNRRPRGVEDLIGSDIAVIADSDYSAALHELSRSRPGLEWTEHDDASVEDLVRRVTDGEFDYTVVDSNLFAILRQFHPEARAAFSLSEAKPIAWALPDHAGDLREAVAAFFAEITATGELHSITDKYYAAARNFDYVGSRAFVRHSRSRLPALRQAFEAAGRSSGFDWRLLAAIAYQESHWRADAVSPTGVRGLMMLTEHAATAVNVSDRTDPEQSIAGGARYLQRMLDKLPTRIAASDRLWMALAAYNIGFGHLEDARIITQINGGNPDSWADVRRHLPLLADEQWHSRVRRGYARGDVPVEYVDNVKRYYQLLQWLDDTAPRDHAVFAVERSETGTPAETESFALEEPADGERTAAARQPLSDDAEKTL